MKNSIMARATKNERTDRTSECVRLPGSGRHVVAVIAAPEQRESDVLEIAQRVNDWSGSLSGLAAGDCEWVGTATLAERAGLAIPATLTTRMAYWREQRGSRVRIVVRDDVVIGAIAVRSKRPITSLLAS